MQETRKKREVPENLLVAHSLQSIILRNAVACANQGQPSHLIDAGRPVEYSGEVPANIGEVAGKRLSHQHQELNVMACTPEAADPINTLSRRVFLAAGAACAATATVGQLEAAESAPAESVVRPPEGKRILLSCKLGMIPSKVGDQELSLAERLQMAGEAGFDGVDFDQAGNYTPQEARDAVRLSGVFVHNAINHAHWQVRLTSANAEERAQGRANIEHCMRVSHAAGGCGVLVVIGRGSDGPSEVIVERCRNEIKALLPLAAALGQPILIENVWNQMFYEHDAPPEQSAEPFVRFIDSFNSPWVGMYYDIGNHWKYGQPGQWIRAFGYRCVKLDVKDFSRADDKFTDIGEGDLPWDQVRTALDEIGFTGWATAEVGGGDVARLTLVRKQMQRVFGL